MNLIEIIERLIIILKIIEVFTEPVEESAAHAGANIFSRGVDETFALWRKVPIGKNPYGHAIFGVTRGEGFSTEETERRYFIGIPGRFLKSEQPAWEGDTGSSSPNSGVTTSDADANPFTLWQPMKGAEKLFWHSDMREGDKDSAEPTLMELIAEADAETLEFAYGYWIARVDLQTEKLLEV